MAKDGHTYKRGNVYWIKYYRGGKPYYESTKSTKEADAKRLLRQRLGQIAEGRFFGLRPERVKFDNLAKDFLNDYRVNGKRSTDKAERSVRHLQHFFGGMRAVDITTDKVRTYVSERLDEGVSNGEINRELAALKRMFNLALQQTPPKVPQKPYIPMLKEGSPRAGFFDHEEFLALRAALPLELRPVVTFGYYTGWRKREVLGMTWDRIDLQARTTRLHPGTTKNDDGRLIYLDGELYATLAELKRQNPFGRWVFNATGSRSKTFAAPGIGPAVRLVLRARCSMTFGARQSGTWSEQGFPSGWHSRSPVIRPAPYSIATTSSVTATCGKPPSARPNMPRAKHGPATVAAVGLWGDGDKNGDSR